VNLERIALMRAEEQIASGAWREADAGERQLHAPRLCVICDEPLPKGSGTRRVCGECHAEGWVAASCKVCGGRLKRRDQTNPDNPERRGACQACRIEMPQVHRGAETIAIARAKRQCTGPGCDRPARARGLCESHYKQERKHGAVSELKYHRRPSVLPPMQTEAA
jgi:hypothetical protein